MVTRISSEASRALEAMDWVERGMPENAEEQVKLLLEYNRIIKILSIGRTLKEGWGKFIYDEAVNRFGEDADYRIRNARKEILKSLAGRSAEELKAVPERLRVELLESSMSDIEKPVRHIAVGLFEKIYGVGKYRSLRFNFFSNVSLFPLSMEKGKNVFSVGEFYIDKKTADFFVGAREAAETMALAGEAISYVRGTKTDWENFEELRGDKKAALYAKNLYKLFHKNLKEDAFDKGLDEIANKFNDGLLVGGLIGLRNHPLFETTIKNMTNVVLIEFERGVMRVYSAEGRGNFFFDRASTDNMVKGIRKYKGIATSYIFVTNLLLDYFSASFIGMNRSVFDKNLRLCVEKTDENEPGEKNEIQSMAVNALATAAFEDMFWAEGKKAVGTAVVGIKSVEILFPEIRKRLKVSLYEEEPSSIGSLIYADATLIYPETGVMDYNIRVSPMLDLVFSSINLKQKFDKTTAKALNSVWPYKLDNPPFQYKSGLYDSIECSLSVDTHLAEAKARRERRGKK